MFEPILAIHPVARATGLFAIALIAGAVIIWLVKRLRGSEANDTQTTHDSLTKFRELHARGGLSDDEYRTIKTKLAAELSPEMESSGVESLELGDSEQSD